MFSELKRVFFLFLGHFYVTAVPYTAQNPDELSYNIGEEVEVVAKSNYGWWKIR